MNHREILATIVAVVLGGVAVTCVLTVSALPHDATPIAMALVAIAGSATGALGGALALPHPVRGENNGPRSRPAPDSATDVSSRG